ncbi:hypothetical protein B7494_g7232, partial [Chlorociboria aeruginascens]
MPHVAQGMDVLSIPLSASPPQARSLLAVPRGASRCIATGTCSRRPPQGPATRRCRHLHPATARLSGHRVRTRWWVRVRGGSPSTPLPASPSLSPSLSLPTAAFGPDRGIAGKATHRAAQDDQLALREKSRFTLNAPVRVKVKADLELEPLIHSLAGMRSWVFHTSSQPRRGSGDSRIVVSHRIASLRIPSPSHPIESISQRCPPRDVHGVYGTSHQTSAQPSHDPPSTVDSLLTRRPISPPPPYTTPKVVLKSYRARHQRADSCDGWARRLPLRTMSLEWIPPVRGITKALDTGIKLSRRVAKSTILVTAAKALQISKSVQNLQKGLEKSKGSIIEAYEQVDKLCGKSFIEALKAD